MKPSFFARNRQNLCSLLKPQSIAIIHSSAEAMRSGDQAYPFRQHSDMLYLCGIQQVGSWLILNTITDFQESETLFTLPSDEHTTLWNGSRLTYPEACEISGVQRCLSSEKLSEYLRLLPNIVAHVYVNTSETELSLSLKNPEPKSFLSDIQKIFPQAEICSLAPLLASLRVHKSDDEIEQIRNACIIARKAFYKMLPAIAPGKMEYEVRAEIVGEFLRSGARGESFDTIAASGGNACVMHYCSNSSKMKENDLLLVDYGAELYEGYASDVTRTFPVSGRFNQRQRRLYDAVLRIYHRAEQLFVPGNTINNINTEVGRMWEEEHIRLGLYSRGDVRDSVAPLWKRYYPHGTTHFLGLDVHDVGSRDEPFRPGMVLTCEPGIYIPEEGTGLRLENDLLITEQAPHNLTADIPIDPDEIEHLLS